MIWIVWVDGVVVIFQFVGNKAREQISKRVLQENRVRQRTFHTCVCVSGGKKCSFFQQFGVLCFLVTRVLRFALLPYYWRITKNRFSLEWNCHSNTVCSSSWSLVQVTKETYSKLIYTETKLKSVFKKYYYSSETITQLIVFRSRKEKKKRKNNWKHDIVIFKRTPNVRQDHGGMIEKEIQLFLCVNFLFVLANISFNIFIVP